MAAKNVVVKQDPTAPVAVEVLAEAVKSLAQGVRQLRRGPLNDRALILLIQNACPVPTTGVSKFKPISQSIVKAVLAGIDNLEVEYLKPPKKGA